MKPTATDLGGRRSLWLLGHESHKAAYEPLIGRHEADVVVVGGGMAGALIAQAFASADVSTVVVEAGLVARGSTALSSALLLQEPDLGLSELHARYGAHASRRIWQMSQTAVTNLVALLVRLRIQCQLRRSETINYATTADAAARLKRELELRKKAGFDGDWLSAGDLRRRTAIAGRGGSHHRKRPLRSLPRVSRRAARGSRVGCARLRAIASAPHPPSA